MVDRGWGRAEHAAAQPAASGPHMGRPFQPGETGNAVDPRCPTRRVPDLRRPGRRCDAPAWRDPPRLDDRARSRRCSRCRSPTCCSARSRCTASTTPRTRCRSARCCRSRPAPARRTAPTARRASATTPASSAKRLLAVEEVRERARAAQAAGATRFCMGAAWRSPKARTRERRGDDPRGAARSGWRPARRSAC